MDLTRGDTCAATFIESKSYCAYLRFKRTGVFFPSVLRRKVGSRNDSPGSPGPTLSLCSPRVETRAFELRALNAHVPLSP